MIGIAFCTAVLTSCIGGRTTHGPAVEFSFLMTGQQQHLAQWRGKWIFLVLVRISEVPSELHLDAVQQVEWDAHDTMPVVLSIAPNEAPMLSHYTDIRGYDFSIGLAEWSVATGQSPLGTLPALPVSYLINPQGQVTQVTSHRMTRDHIEKQLRGR